MFRRAFADKRFEERLVEGIILGSIEASELKLLLAYYAGVPRQAFDLTHSGAVSLEQILAGTARDTAPEDDAEDDAELDDPDDPSHGGSYA